MVASLVVICVLSACATANKATLSESLKKSSGNSMSSYAVYPANSEMIQVEFANFVEENILDLGGKIYDRNVRYDNAGSGLRGKISPKSDSGRGADNNAINGSEEIEGGGKAYGFAPLAPIAIAFVSEVISQFSEKKEKEGKGSSELLGKAVVSHDIVNNPAEYAIFTYASSPNNPNAGRVRIINKKNGEIVANFTVDGSRNDESIFLNAIVKSIDTSYKSSPDKPSSASAPAMIGGTTYKSSTASGTPVTGPKK